MIKNETDSIKLDTEQLEKEDCATQLSEGNQDFSVDLKELRVTRDPETKRFVCELCEKSFQHKQGLQKHFNNEHNRSNSRVKYQRNEASSPSKVPCEFCPKVFKVHVVYNFIASQNCDQNHLLLQGSLSCVTT